MYEKDTVKSGIVYKIQPLPLPLPLPRILTIFEQKRKNNNETYAS
jgi:hypothetical protein